MKKWSFLIVLMLSGLTFVQTASTAERYVALDGTGHGMGGWENATNDLQGAIDASAKGDTVWVSNGVYQSGGRTNYPAGSTLSN